MTAFLRDRLERMVGDGRQPFIASVEGLRGLAALTVVMVHLYAMPYLAQMTPPHFPAWAHATLVTGGRGVELFFIISGFLIPASLVRHRVVSKFLYDRAMRIMPLFVLLHVALFTVGPLVGYKFFPSLDAVGYIRAFLSNLFFVPALFGDPIAQQNAWTLTYEWAFYLWFAALFIAIMRGWMVASIALLMAALVLMGVFPLLTYFALGVVMASRRFSLALPGAAGLALGAVCMAAMYYACEYITPYVGLPPAAILFALVLAPESGWARLLSSAPLRFLGKISYSLYLVHPFVLFPLLSIAKLAFARGYDPWLILAAFAVSGATFSLVAAKLSYELVEVRARRALHAMLTGSGRRDAAVSAS